MSNPESPNDGFVDALLPLMEQFSGRLSRLAPEADITLRIDDACEGGSPSLTLIVRPDALAENRQPELRLRLQLVGSPERGMALDGTLIWRAITGERVLCKHEGMCCDDLTDATLEVFEAECLADLETGLRRALHRGGPPCQMRQGRRSRGRQLWRQA